MLHWSIQGNNLTVVVQNQVHTISAKTHAQYQKIVDALKAKQWNIVEEYINPAVGVTKYTKGKASVSDGQLLWEGKPIHNLLADRILTMWNDGFPIDSFVAFFTNLQEHPCKEAVEDLFAFLDYGKNPITEDGCFVAFKRVRNDYKDIHSNTISNHVGAVVTMDRKAVNANRNETCSTGLHFCSLAYLKDSGFGSSMAHRTMLVKINPKNVVSIPSDYNNSKGRCCEYEVIGELESMPKQFTTPVYKTPAPNPETAESSELATTVATKSATNGKQPLSMTPNAIRKRELRALKARKAALTENIGTVAPKVAVPTTPVVQSPKIAQQVAKGGKPLSMTPNAIRKREKRAAGK